MQYKRLQREYDEASGMEAVQPNKRLNQERLRKLQEIGFAWSAKHVRKQRNNSLQGNAAARPPPAPPPLEALPPSPDNNVVMHNNPAHQAMMMPPAITMVPAPAGILEPAPRPRKTEPRQAGRFSDQQWEEMYQRLVRYKEEHGDCLVPRK